MNFRNVSDMPSKRYENNIILWKSNVQVTKDGRENTANGDFASELYKKRKRLFHITQEKRDIESGFRAIGAGVAITGVIGPGIGIGYVFGTYCSAVARNPSLAGQLFNAAIMGAAFCEALGLFAMMISFLAFLM
ncbi:hypothetical protein RUM43_004574 [Polyplax serrata]|uniref:ATPase protein 9 n=1 Tax=Polyplax serrata TaxID=468196 RepID=A0AAN8SBS1_POLSC